MIVRYLGPDHLVDAGAASSRRRRSAPASCSCSACSTACPTRSSLNTTDPVQVGDFIRRP
ncbi:MAG: hypothetical protein MZW92_69190 [Comamonadaceae bacterium]|nr:hypothetical protein [Comamonadaceae bacterium]